jgi:UDP-glucose:(heptosyl)LPS alpha-1,3-glucosyltransferase
VIHNGVEWKEMESDFSVWAAQRKLGFQKYRLDPDVFHFLFIGNGYLRKGLDRLLEGLSRLPMKNFCLSVIGKDNKMEIYQAKAVQLGLKTQVRFFGAQSDIRLFYQMADVLVIPSFYDPFANVTVEALAMGLFTVSSKYNGGHEILTQDNGLVIDNLLDPDSMVEALTDALKHKKTEASAFAARNSVEPFDFSKQMRTLIDAC